MSTIDSREIIIKVMRKVVVDVSPEVIIRRLQNDNAFVIYSNVNITDINDNSHKYPILIDIITEKTKPEFFKTIKKMIRIVDSDKEIENTKYQSYKPIFRPVSIKGEKEGVVEKLVFVRDEESENSNSHSYIPMFYPVSVKDVKGDIIEKLIKFNSIDMVLPKYNNSTGDYIDSDDEFNIIYMLYNCAEFIKDHESMLYKLYPTNSSIYRYFRYGFVLMNEQAAKDEVLEKVITEDLYGYNITFSDKFTKQGMYCELSRMGYDYISYFYKCKNELCNQTHDDEWPIDLVLYYTAKSSLDNNKTVYLKGEFIYLPLTFFDDTDFNITERYIIPRTWFDFEGFMYMHNAKIDDIICNNCGKSLLDH